MTDEQTTAQILVVDDEEDHAEVMAEALRRLGHVCTLVHNLPSATEELSHGRFDLIVTDLVMDGEDDGLAVLAEARQRQPHAETILVTAHGDIPTATRAVKQGAYDFIEKPLDLNLFRDLCGRAIAAVLERSVDAGQDHDEGFEGIIGASPAIREVIGVIKRIAPADVPVLVTGENGTGKELVAHAIHRHSQRSEKRFRALNCAGLSDSLLETELFGHVKGAFTNADRDREGVFEYAHNGTLFLDEIGDMPMIMQAKLLRVLESGEVVRVGANEPRHVNVRLISATNKDLRKLTGEERFREDLYFRIRGVEVHVPPLRQRREDIPLLVRHFMTPLAEQMRRPTPTLAEDTQRALMQYDWPGNIRELMRVIQNMVLVAEGDTLELRHVPDEVRSGGGDVDTSNVQTVGLSLEQIEKQAIRNALRFCGGNREQTAKMLGIGERTLYRKLKEYGIK